MRTICRHWLALCMFLLLLAGCGGGDSSTTTISGAGLNSLGQNPAVSLPYTFTQANNNMQVKVEDGPRSFQLSPNANILYATVTVCHPTNTTLCVDIPHVQVDTGSVGLRVLASQVKSLNLPPQTVTSGATSYNTWECYPFVIGGVWGPNAVARVTLGKLQSYPLAIQLIEDNPDPKQALQADAGCIKASNNSVLSSAAALGSNGILGIGSTSIDCGQTCLLGNYTGTYVQYYACPAGTVTIGACSQNTPVPVNLQVSNPVYQLPQDNNGVILAMPAVTNPGAATASGELVFGINTQTNNQLPLGVRKVFLGLDSSPANIASYLNISTEYAGATYVSSYLDTGTNGLFFDSPAGSPISNCTGGTWYCPNSLLNLSAKLWDGGVAQSNPVNVAFQIGNAEALFATNNTAFSGLGGAASKGSKAFAWGMPFFYGKRVYQSIWDITQPLSLPLANPQSNPAWYAWEAI